MKSDKMNLSLFDKKEAENYSEASLNSLVHDIEKPLAHNQSKGKNTLITICGGSCTGKSSIVTKSLIDHFQDRSVVLHQDVFQNNEAYLKNISPTYKWDHPDNFSIGECDRVLTKLLNNEEVDIPDYSFKSDEPIGKVMLQPASIIFFEGLFSGHGKLSEKNDLLIYIEAPFYTRVIRRIFRNTLERYKGRDPALILEGFIETVTKAHHDFVVNQRDKADYILKMPFSFQELIDRFDLSDLGKANQDLEWRVDLQEDLTIAISNKGLFSLVYRGLKYLEFEVENRLIETLKNLDWQEC